MKHSNLSEHKLKKGKFITPLHSIPNSNELNDNESWAYGRMPEYLWIGLILKQFGREEGLRKSFKIISSLHKIAPNLLVPKMSEILALDEQTQRLFYKEICDADVQDALAPLTIYLTLTKAPIFSKNFYCSSQNYSLRCDKLLDTMRELMDHQSFESTDVRYIVLCFMMMSGKIHIKEEQIEKIKKYSMLLHCDEEMLVIRPFVRSLEMMSVYMVNTDYDYLENFWRCVSEMTDCDLYVVEFPEEKRDITFYMEELHEIYQYLYELIKNADPLNEKMKVLLGLATYSYKRLKEIYDYKMFNSLSARSCVRVLIENYIMMKYLVKNEKNHENIYYDYQIYGLGLYKLVLEKLRENSLNIDSHVDMNYIKILVNEFKDEEFIDMDTSYFNHENIRIKAINVDEKELYGLYYDYDSSFEHGLWGAVRESSMIKCDNPAHKYHCLPDIESQQTLKSALPDCIMVMNKIISFLNEIYSIPKQLLEGVMNFDIKPIIEKTADNSR